MKRNLQITKEVTIPMSDTNNTFAPLDEWGDTAKPCKKHPRCTVVIDQVCPACNAEEDGHDVVAPEGREGIVYCKRCKCGEGSLATHCPGRPIDQFAQEEIYHGQLDFIDGAWMEVILL
jgi:hypothetical protein